MGDEPQDTPASDSSSPPLDPEPAPDLELAPDPEPPLGPPAPAPASEPLPDPTPRLPSATLPTARMRFLRAFCLGVLTTVVLAVVAAGGFVYYIYKQVLDDTPMPIRQDRWTPQEWKSIQSKFDSYGSAIYRGYDREVQFNQREFNIFANEEIRNLGYAMGGNAFYVRIIGDQVEFHLRMYWKEWKKWVNVQARGEMYIRDGRLSLQLDYAKIGHLTPPDSFLPSIAERMIEHVHNTPAYQEGIALVRTARVQDGKLHLRLDERNFREFVNRRMKEEGEL